MLKKDLSQIIEKVVEAGKGLALAEMLPDGELKDRTIKLMNNVVDDVKKRLEVYCKDSDLWKGIMKNGR